MTSRILHILLRIYFLLRESAEGVINFLSLKIEWPEWAGVLPKWFPDTTVLDLMFGAGLVGLLIFIIVKFYLDVIL